MSDREPLLYGELAHLWPLLSPPEHYAGEAATIRGVIEQKLGSAQRKPVRRVLELGAGGGHTLYYLTERYETVAVDLSEPMLANCRRLNPETRTVRGDMRSVRLGEMFDVVLIHDAIDYLTSEAELAAALDTAAAHLEPGGLLLVAPTYLRESFEEYETELEQNGDDALALTYLSYVHDPDPSDDTFELILVYLICDVAGDRSVRVVEDRHTCGLFSAATWRRLISEAGFSCEQREEEAWTLFVAVRGE